MGVDPSTGTSTTRSGLGLKELHVVSDLAFDPASCFLFGIDDATDLVITLNPSTGVETLDDSTSFGIRGLAGRIQ